MCADCWVLQIPLIVHKYLSGVRKVQASMRDFLACKRAKILALGKVWEKLEVRYIKRKLEERRAQKRGLVEKISAHNAALLQEEEAVAQQLLDAQIERSATGKKKAGGSNKAGTNTSSTAGSKSGPVEVDAQSKIDMKNQAKQWSKIDAKMETYLKQLKASGVIVDEEEAETVRKLMLPESTRNRVLCTNICLSLLRAVLTYNSLCLSLSLCQRKEFYTSQKAIIRRQAENDSVFKESHALDLLKGRDADITRIIHEKFDKRLVHLAYKPFMLFQ